MSEEQVRLMLGNKDLVSNIPGLAEADQTHFVDNVDQVREHGSSSVLRTSTHPFHQDISCPRLEESKAYIGIGDHTERNRTPSIIGLALYGAQDTR